MAAFVALLRGVNVGGHNKLPMAALRSIAEAQGAEDVSTYIQSGNVVFRAGKTSAASFEKELGAAIEKEFGFRPDIFVIGVSDFRKVLKNNPYADDGCDPSRLFVAFFKSPADKNRLKDVEKALSGGERICVKGAAIYFDAPEGVGRSKGAETLGRVFPGGTMRNWRTCLKLQEMADALA